jgi:hypothetical protein
VLLVIMDIVWAFLRQHNRANTRSYFGTVA